LNTLN